MLANASLRAVEQQKAPVKKYRVGVIGATGRGDYGHSLDMLWRSLPGAEVVAVADADPRGLETAGKRLQVERLFGDYQQMLQSEDIDVAVVCPRWVDQREAMIQACASAGCHMFVEKPFAGDAVTADRMLAACRAAKVKVAVAHPQRAAPGIQEIRARLVDGRLGNLLSMRCRGKEDARAGGEDMMVLGCHLFDLMHYLAGSPQWCSANVLQGDRPITRADARQGTEPVGPLAGDSVAAMFGFSKGVNGYFESKAAASAFGSGERYVLELVCSKGVVLARPEVQQFFLGEPSVAPAKQQSWERLGDADWEAKTVMERFAYCKQQIALDLLKAIEEDREPLTSGTSSALTIEMVQAVYASHLAGQRIPLPLEDRRHPLAMGA